MNANICLLNRNRKPFLYFYDQQDRLCHIFCENCIDNLMPQTGVGGEWLDFLDMSARGFKSPGAGVHLCFRDCEVLYVLQCDLATTLAPSWDRITILADASGTKSVWYIQT